MKISGLNRMAVLVPALAILLQSHAALAQTVMCPVGLTCTPIVPQQTSLCPTGYTCIPIVMSAAVNSGGNTTMTPMTFGASMSTMAMMATTSTSTQPKPGLRGVVTSTNFTMFNVNATGLGVMSTTSFMITVIPTTIVRKMEATSSPTAIRPGDMVFVQGSLGPVGLTATKVVDHGPNFWWTFTSTSTTN